MRIDESKIFEFRFPFYMGEFSIPIRAKSIEEAAEQLKRTFNTWMIELATEFPKMSPEDPPAPIIPKESPPGPTNTAPASAVPSYVLELNIETLVKDLVPLKKPRGANNISKLVKEWTGFEYSPENYQSIIATLEKMKSET